MEIPDEIRQRVDAAADETRADDPERAPEVDAEFDRRIAADDE